MYADEVFFPRPVSRELLASSHSPSQWVPGTKRLERECDNVPPSSAEVKNGGIVPPLHHTFLWHGAYLSTRKPLPFRSSFPPSHHSPIIISFNTGLSNWKHCHIDKEYPTILVNVTNTLSTKLFPPSVIINHIYNYSLHVSSIFYLVIFRGFLCYY
jgi:hypothetical protein